MFLLKTIISINIQLLNSPNFILATRNHLWPGATDSIFMLYFCAIFKSCRFTSFGSFCGFKQKKEPSFFSPASVSLRRQCLSSECSALSSSSDLLAGARYPFLLRLPWSLRCMFAKIQRETRIFFFIKNTQSHKVKISPSWSKWGNGFPLKSHLRQQLTYYSLSYYSHYHVLKGRIFIFFNCYLSDLTWV